MTTPTSRTPSDRAGDEDTDGAERRLAQDVQGHRRPPPAPAVWYIRASPLSVRTGRQPRSYSLGSGASPLGVGTGITAAAGTCASPSSTMPVAPGVWTDPTYQAQDVEHQRDYDDQAVHAVQQTAEAGQPGPGVLGVELALDGRLQQGNRSPGVVGAMRPAAGEWRGSVRVPPSPAAARG